MEARVKKFLMVAMLCVSGTAMAAQQGHAPATGGAKDAHAAEVHLAYDHPRLPGDARWAGATTLVILGLFLLAAGVGVVVRLNAPEELPETHSHDEHGG